MSACSCGEVELGAVAPDAVAPMLELGNVRHAGAACVVIAPLGAHREDCVCEDCVAERLVHSAETWDRDQVALALGLALMDAIERVMEARA